MELNRRFTRACFLATLALLPLLLVGQTPKPQKPSGDLKRADAAFRAGYAAHQAGELEQARAKFAEAARLAPQVAEAHEALGAVLVELGKPAEAVAELETALEHKPADPAIESNLAMALSKAGEPAKALPHFSAAFQATQQPGQPPVSWPRFSFF